jgi:hypothetical protein
MLHASAVAQTEGVDYLRVGHAAFFVTTTSDYQCVGINPANLGFIPQPDLYQLASPVGGGIEWERRDISIGISEVGTSIRSTAMPRGPLVDMFFGANEELTSQQKVDAASRFVNEGVDYSVNGLLIGAAYQTQDVGGFAVTVRDRITGTFKMNESGARFAFEGRRWEYFDSVGFDWKGDTIGYATTPLNYSQIFDGTILSMLWVRELGLSWGIEMFSVGSTRFFGGVTGKYLMGLAMLDARVENGTLRARSALSGLFDINYGKGVSPSKTANQIVADGWGMDIGFTALVGERWSFGASIIDLGKLTWDGNVYAAKDTILNGLTSTGFASYNIFEEAPKITGEGNFFKWEGLETTTTHMPTRIRFGGAYDMSTRWRFGADVVIPVTTTAGGGDYVLISGGVDMRPIAWLRLSGGILWPVGVRPVIPFGAMFTLFDGLWELGLTTNDLSTLVFINDPTVSIGTALFRFRF